MPWLNIDGEIALLDLGDGENRFTDEWVEELVSAADEIANSAEPFALVTIGSGKFYSNGLDTAVATMGPDERKQYVARMEGVLAKFLTLPVPTVAAVNGHAFGAGGLLAIAHDYRVMREDRGYFCLPEIDLGLGFSPGLVELVQGKLGSRAAAALMLTARRFAAPQAAELGIVDALSDVDKLRETACAIVDGLAGKPRTAVGNTKRLMYAAAVEALTH